MFEVLKKSSLNSIFQDLFNGILYFCVARNILEISLKIYVLVIITIHFFLIHQVIFCQILVCHTVHCEGKWKNWCIPCARRIIHYRRGKNEWWIFNYTAGRKKMCMNFLLVLGKKWKKFFKFVMTNEAWILSDNTSDASDSESYWYYPQYPILFKWNKKHLIHNQLNKPSKTVTTDCRPCSHQI